MKHGKKPLLLPLLIVGILLLFLAFTSLTHAQTPTPSSNYDVTVSPVFFDLTANPGDTISNKIRIRNNTTSPLPIKIEVKKMTGNSNGNLTLTDDPNDPSLSWITFTSNTFVASSLEWNDIPFTITIPKDAAYGYYFAISLTQDNTSPLKKNGTTITGAAAVPILLNVTKAGAKMEGKLLSLSVDKGFYEYPPVKFSTVFGNTGNVHIRPSGNIFIKDFLGNQVGMITVNENHGAVLPNVKKTFESTWDDGFITVEPKMDGGEPVLDKNGKAETELKFRFDKILDFRIGRYTASELLVVSTANRDIPFTAETSFFVFPWKIAGVILIFILFLIYREYQVRKLKRELKTLKQKEKE
jgi:hypothetical protein